MNEARFMGLLAAYGADLARWPEDDRLHAEVFLEGAPHRIRDVWESERAFDHLLSLERDLPASLALETAIIGTSPGRRRSNAPVPCPAPSPSHAWQGSVCPTRCSHWGACR